MRFLLDSGVAGDYINRKRGVFDRAQAEIRKGNPIGTCIPVLAELAAGVERSSTRDRNMRRLEAAANSLRLWPFDRQAAFQYGRLQAVLRAAGRPMQLIDVMIAAIAITLGDTIVATRDSDLSAIPGLQVVDWTE